MHRNTLLLGGLAAIVFSGQSAFAHHALNSQFDVVHLKTMQGVLVKLDDINPHAYWHFDVMGQDGKVQSWNVESVGVVGIRRAGLQVKQTIKPGESYTFTVAPNRDSGVHNGLMTEIVVDGKRCNLEPGE